MRKTALAQQLAVVAGFETPQASLEQYPTPPELAAHLIHIADLLGDIEERMVIDLGTGTGMLALGAALRGPAEVVGLDLDGGALRIARKNRRRVGTRTPISWVRADVTRPPLAVRASDRTDPGESDDGDSGDRDTGGETGETVETGGPVTVVMNPPSAHRKAMNTPIGRSSKPRHGSRTSPIRYITAAAASSSNGSLPTKVGRLPRAFARRYPCHTSSTSTARRPRS